MNYLIRPGIDVVDEVKLLNTIINSTCRQFNVTRDELRSKSRQRGIVYPRHVIHYMLVKYTKMKVTAIAKSVSNMHHASVYHAAKIVPDLSMFDKDFSRKVEEIERDINVAPIGLSGQRRKFNTQNKMLMVKDFKYLSHVEKLEYLNDLKLEAA